MFKELTHRPGNQETARSNCVDEIRRGSRSPSVDSDLPQAPSSSPLDEGTDIHHPSQAENLELQALIDKFKTSLSVDEKYRELEIRDLAIFIQYERRKFIEKTENDHIKKCNDFDQDYDGRLERRKQELREQLQLPRDQEDQRRQTFDQDYNALLQRRKQELKRLLQLPRDQEDQRRQAFDQHCNALLQRRKQELKRLLRLPRDQEDQRRQTFDQNIRAGHVKQESQQIEYFRRNVYDEWERKYFDKEMDDYQRTLRQPEIARRNVYDEWEKRYLSNGMYDYRKTLRKPEISRRNAYDEWERKYFNKEMDDYQQTLNSTIVQEEHNRRRKYNDEYKEKILKHIEKSVAEKWPQERQRRRQIYERLEGQRKELERRQRQKT